MTCGCDIGDFCPMESWEVGRSPNFTGKIKMRRICHALDRDHIGKARIGVNMASNHIEKINHSAVFQAL